uniref:TAP2 n=2 Tax=Nipponia nippon TaxID=128390 RepID=A0A0S2RSR7_NIPNI|nr:TAP2 [Nipponia nippon]
MALLPAVRLACLLLLVDLVVLAALARLAPALAWLGPVAAWLEAGLRLPAFVAAGRLLAPGGPRGAAVVLSLTPATFLTLRSLLVPYGATPFLLAAAAPAWLALTHGATAAALLAWAAPVPGKAVGTESPVAVRRLLALAWTEWPVLGGAFLFLVLAVLGVGTVVWGPWCGGDRGLGLGGGGGPAGPGRRGRPVAAPRALNPAAPAQVLQQAMLDATAKTAAVVQEAVSSIETVRTFAGEEEEERRHSQALAERLRLKDRIDVERALFTLIRRALQLAVQVLVLCRGHQQLREGTVTTGSLVTFLLYQAKVGHHVQALVFGHGNLLSKAAAGRKILEYLDREPTGVTGGTRAPATLRGHVAFQRVSFAYPVRPEHLVLQDVSFELRPGEVTALAGLNGSGKSTCAGLLERFYEPGAGEVLLDGVPLRDYEHRYLHRQVALVGQEPVLFSGTIRDNIAFGLEGCGEEEVRAAAAAAGALGFILALDRGFESDVGEKGGQLSAGEKQRIAIARALVRQPTVLILDEATSALEGEAEAAPQQGLQSGGVRTELLITHRRRMLDAADRVVGLEGGAVVAMGTPAELRSRRGPYSRLLQRSPSAGRPETPGVGYGERQLAPAPGAGQEEGAAPIGTEICTK